MSRSQVSEFRSAARIDASLGHHGVQKDVPGFGRVRLRELEVIGNADQPRSIAKAAMHEGELAVVKTGAEPQAPTVDVESD